MYGIFVSEIMTEFKKNKFHWNDNQMLNKIMHYITVFFMDSMADMDLVFSHLAIINHPVLLFCCHFI